MRASLVVLALAPILACGPSTATAPAPTGPAAPREVAPAPSPADPPATPPVTPPDPDAVRRKRAETALARIPQVKQTLAKLRALPFKQDVPAEYQTQDSFKKFVASEVARELAPTKAKQMATALFHVGLLTQEIDLAETLEHAMVTQAAAYYDPRQKKFFMVMAPQQDLMLDGISAHELTHALQDQYFDLTTYLGSKPDGASTLDDDVGNARRFIVEGEATLTMSIYAPAAMGMDALAGATRPLIKRALAQQANLSLEDLKTMSKQMMGGLDLDEDLKKSVEAMDTIPPIILIPMLDSYMKGTLPVLVAYEHGGWAEVGKLYTNPPQSTEQVLHPETKLYPKRDLPRTVTLPKLADHELVYENVMGELEWRIYFLLWNKTGAERAAAGWDGDRWAVYRDKGGALVGLLATVWDSPKEAAEFAAAYKASLSARFPGADPKDKDGAARPDGRRVQVVVDKASVFIVDGAPAKDKALMAKLRATRIK